MKSSRREFLGGMCLAGASAAVGCKTVGGAAGEASASGEVVRFCAFADIHYTQGKFWPNQDRVWLDRILQRAVDEKVDFIVSMGDMSFNPIVDHEYEEYYRDFPKIKTYQILGNHEFEAGKYEDFAKFMGMPNNFYHWDCHGFRFIALDPHYHYVNGKLEHFVGHCSYPKDPQGCFFVSEEQLVWLKKTILESPYPCVVMSHESIERWNSIGNRAAILDIFKEANAACPGKVRLCINGHFHKDSFRFLDGIAYLDLNSASYDIDKGHSAYPSWVAKKFGAAGCTLVWNDPLSAIITLSTDGVMKIEGSKSTFYLGVTPQMAGWKPDSHGRIASPQIQSVDLKINYGRIAAKEGL